MVIENCKCARHSLVSFIGSTMVGPEKKNFKVKRLRWHKNNIIEIHFCKYSIS